MLNIIFQGPLTDMASALLMEPRIEQRPVRVVWIGGGERPEYGIEYNLSNDIHAENVVFRSRLELWQIPFPLYRHFCVSYAELMAKVYPRGAIGRYLTEQLIQWNEEHNRVYSTEYRSLGDSPGVGVLLVPNAGNWRWQPAPEFDPQNGDPRQTGRNRPIRIYETFDARFLLEDFFAKLEQFASACVQ